MENRSWLKVFRREVVSGSTGTLRKILNKKPSDVEIDSHIMSGGTSSALEYLAYKKKPSRRDGKVIKILLQHGANPLKTNKTEYPIIYLSFQKFDSDVILELLRHLQDINIPLDPAKKNALHLSALHGKLSVMKYCLKRKADPNRPFQYGLTPLFMTLSSPKHRDKMIKLLKDNGADINRIFHDGLTALHLAMTSKNSEELVESILKCKPNMNSLDSRGLTPLNFLLINGVYNLRILENLLKHGSDPNFPGWMGGNALHILATSSKARYKTSKVSNVLLKYGASINQKDQYGNTPLHYAAYEGLPALVQNFVDNGADLTIKNQQGYTALQLLQICHAHTNMACIMMKEVILQSHSQQFKLSNDLNTLIDSSGVLSRINRECREELHNMENIRIGETSVTLLKILTSNVKEIAKYARKKETMSALSKTRATNYKHYGKKLRKKIIAGLRRRRLEHYGEDIVNTYAETTVPTTCMQLIVDNLINRDVARLKKDRCTRKRRQSTILRSNIKRMKI